MDGLKPGLKNETSHLVHEEDLASKVGSGLVNVFSTAMMVAGMEATAVECVQKYLPQGFTTVGTHLDISHKSATPLGMMVNFSAELLEISANGKGFKFAVRAWDAAGAIGEGIHERVMVEHDKFEARTLEKARKVKS